MRSAAAQACGGEWDEDCGERRNAIINRKQYTNPIGAVIEGL